MPKITTLRTAILMAEEGTDIYAQTPFHAESKARIVRLDFDGLPSENVELQGFEKFLDSDTANEVLDIVHDSSISEDQLVELVACNS